MVDERLHAYRALIADVFELAGLSRATSEHTANSLGQTAARWHVMSVASGQALNVPAIARRLGLTRQSVQRVVNDLAETGLVSLKPNPDHELSSLVTLTKQGRDITEQLFQQSEASRTALLDRAAVSIDELHEARRIIRTLLTSFAQETASVSASR